MAFYGSLGRSRNNSGALVLVLGLIAAYLGNLFRMVVIGVVGYFNGIDALLWAHKNVGWIIFLSWSAVFWYLVMRYANRRSTRAVANRD
jgi:exosortase/archaeosortase family protein